MSFDHPITLANGREVHTQALRPGGTGERTYVGIVIAHLPDNDLHPYVTWLVAGDDLNEPFDAGNGDYCQTLDEAVESWESRSRWVM